MSALPDRCPRCNRVPTKAKRLVEFDFKRDDGARLVGVLCVVCIDQMAKDYKLEETFSKRRGGFKVIDIADIPKTPRPLGR